MGTVLGWSLDLDALAWEVSEHLQDMTDAKARTDRATEWAHGTGGLY